MSAHPPSSGSYATVRLAIDTRTQRQVACKTIRLRPKSVPLRESADLSLATRESEHEHAKARRQLVMKEAQVLRNLKHVSPRLYPSIVCQAETGGIDFASAKRERNTTCLRSARLHVRRRQIILPLAPSLTYNVDISSWSCARGVTSTFG